MILYTRYCLRYSQHVRVHATYLSVPCLHVSLGEHIHYILYYIIFYTDIQYIRSGVQYYTYHYYDSNNVMWALKKGVVHVLLFSHGHGLGALIR